MRYLFVLIIAITFSCGKRGVDNRKDTPAPIALGDESMLLPDNLLEKLLESKFPLLASTKTVNFQTDGSPCKLIKMFSGAGLVSFADSSTPGVVLSNQPLFYLQSTDDVLICDWSLATDGKKVSQSMRILYAPFFLSGSITESSKGLFSISSMTKAPISVQTFLLGTSVKSADFSAHSLAVDGYDTSKLSQFTGNSSTESVKVGKTNVQLVRQAAMTLPTHSKILYLQNLLGDTRFRSDVGVQSLPLGESHILLCPNSKTAGGSEGAVEILASCDSLADVVKARFSQSTPQNLFVQADKPSAVTMKNLLDPGILKSIHTLNLNFSNVSTDVKESFLSRLSARNFAGNPNFENKAIGLTGTEDSKNTDSMQLGPTVSATAASVLGQRVSRAQSAAAAAGSSVAGLASSNQSAGLPSSQSDISLADNNGCQAAGVGYISYLNTKDSNVSVSIVKPEKVRSYIVGFKQKTWETIAGLQTPTFQILNYEEAIDNVPTSLPLKVESDNLQFVGLVNFPGCEMGMKTCPDPKALFKHFKNNGLSIKFEDSPASGILSYGENKLTLVDTRKIFYPPAHSYSGTYTVYNSDYVNLGKNLQFQFSFSANGSAPLFEKSDYLFYKNIAFGQLNNTVTSNNINTNSMLSSVLIPMVFQTWAKQISADFQSSLPWGLTFGNMSDGYAVSGAYAVAYNESGSYGQVICMQDNLIQNGCNLIFRKKLKDICQSLAKPSTSTVEHFLKIALGSQNSSLIEKSASDTLSKCTGQTANNDFYNINVKYGATKPQIVLEALPTLKEINLSACGPSPVTANKDVTCLVDNYMKKIDSYNFVVLNVKENIGATFTTNRCEDSSCKSVSINYSRAKYQANSSEFKSVNGNCQKSEYMDNYDSCKALPLK